MGSIGHGEPISIAKSQALNGVLAGHGNNSHVFLKEFEERKKTKPAVMGVTTGERLQGGIAHSRGVQGKGSIALPGLLCCVVVINPFRLLPCPVSQLVLLLSNCLS